MWSILRRNPLLFILLGAFILRAGTAVWVQHRLDHVWQRPFLIEGDAEGYWKLGRNLAAGESYAIDTPPRRVLRMPGFPAVLAAAIAVFGDRLLPARIVLAVVGTAACGIVFLLGRELFGERIGLIAAGLTAVSPVMTGFSVLILSETLFAAGLLAALILLAKLVRTGFEREQTSRGIALSVAAGAVLAAACYVRPGWLAAVPIFACLYLLTADNRKRAAVRGLLLLAVTFVVLLPWAWRNYRVTGHWVFTTLWVGPSLYDGLNPAATGASDMRFFERDRRQGRTAGMSEYEIDRYYRRKAWQFALENPVEVVRLAGVKLVRFWMPWPQAEQFDRPIYRVAVAGFFIPIVALAAAGWWSCRNRFWAWALTAGPVLYFTAVHMVFVASLRYRLPAEYPLCVLSAVGIDHWLREVRSLGRR